MKISWLPLKRISPGLPFALQPVLPSVDSRRLMNENAALRQRNAHLEDLKDPSRDRHLNDSTHTTTAGTGDPGISWSVSEGMVGGMSRQH
jgi:hypothetical protein